MRTSEGLSCSNWRSGINWWGLLLLDLRAALSLCCERGVYRDWGMKSNGPVVTYFGFAIYAEHSLEYQGVGLKYTQNIGTNYLYSSIHSFFHHLLRSFCLLEGCVCYVHGTWGDSDVVTIFRNLLIGEGGFSVCIDSMTNKFCWGCRGRRPHGRGNVDTGPWRASSSSPGRELEMKGREGQHPGCQEHGLQGKDGVKR